MKRLLFVFSISISSIVYICAQTNDSTYQQYLLNNKNVPKRIYYSTDVRNILKTEITDVLDGVLPVIWEHRFSDNFGLDGGVGLIMPYSIIDVFGKGSSNQNQEDLFGYNTSFANDKFGASFQIEPKLFLADNGLFIDSKGHSFYSVFYNKRAYDRLGISSIGVGWGRDIEFEKINLQLIFSVAKVTQTAYFDYKDLKYIDFLTVVDGKTANSFRASIRIQIGFNFNPKMQARK